MMRVKDDELEMTKHLVYLYEGKPFSGIAFERAPNGQVISEITYQNGMMEGIGRDWYESGELCTEYSYKNNNLHGLCKEWYPGNKLHSETLYEFSICINRRVWDEDGNITENFKISETDPLFKSLQDLRKALFEQSYINEKGKNENESITIS